MYGLSRDFFINQQFCSFICLIFPCLVGRVENAQVLNAQVIKQDNVSETKIILKKVKYQQW